MWFPDSLVITRSDFTTKNNSVDEGFHYHCFAGRLLDRFDIKFSTYLPKIVSKHSEVTQLNKRQGFFFMSLKGSGSEALSWHTPTKTSRKVPHLSPSPHTQNRKATSMGKSSREARVRRKDGLNFSAHVTDAFSMADQKRLYRGLCPSLTHFLSAMRSTRL